MLFMLLLCDKSQVMVLQFCLRSHRGSVCEYPRKTNRNMMALLSVIVFFSGGLLILPLASHLAYQLFARFRRRMKSTKHIDFACIITAYKDLGITYPLVNSLLDQEHTRFHVYLVADDCALEPEGLPEHAHLTVLRPSKPLGSKVKSLKYAHQNFKRNHDVVVVLDADNLAHPLFLSRLQEAFENGYAAVQGQRLAKNLGSIAENLDAMSEFYYNFMVRKVPYGLGSSATIAGSGMGVQRAVFEQYLALFDQPDALVISEDKILQTWLVDQGHQIGFAEKAIVLDEKVTTGADTQRQRTRWLASYFEQFKAVGKVFLKGIKRGNWNQTYFGFICVYPPLVILVMITALGFLAALFGTLWQLQFMVWSGIAFVGNFYWVLKRHHTPKTVLAALPKIPVFIYYQIRALMGMEAVKSDFLATQHTKRVSFAEAWTKHYDTAYRNYITSNYFIEK
jgi:cellulose synthase/poly-beta-1,6-N-acetylglucosamine synthase-like glycosyltransferase